LIAKSFQLLPYGFVGYGSHLTVTGHQQANILPAPPYKSMGKCPIKNFGEKTSRCSRLDGSKYLAN